MGKNGRKKIGGKKMGGAFCSKAAFREALATLIAIDGGSTENGSG